MIMPKLQSVDANIWSHGCNITPKMAIRCARIWVNHQRCCGLPRNLINHFILGNRILNTAEKPKSPLPDGKGIAFIQASWHKDIVEQSRLSFESHLLDHNIHPFSIQVFEVPGSLEIPLQCKMLAKTGRYQVIVAAGLIVDSGIYRHDFVASTVLDAMMQVSLEAEVPVLSLVLTPHEFSEPGHHDFFFEHFKQKGKEAAEACLGVLENQRRLSLDES